MAMGRLASGRAATRDGWSMIMPPLKGLYAFEAVVRRGSYKAAAEELCVSRSAISHQIRALENLLKVRLFHRGRQGVGLTEAGRVLHQNLSEAFDLVRRSLASVEALATEHIVGVALPPHFALKWLLPRLPALRKRYPSVELHLTYPVKSIDFLDPHVHISIKWQHSRQVDNRARLLVDGALVPACSPILLEGERSISDPLDLKRITLLHEQDERYWEEWLEKAELKRLAPFRNEIFDDSNVLYQAAIDGQGLALVCPSLADEELQSGDLVCPFDITLDSYGYYAMAAPDYREHTNVKRVLDWLCEQGGSGMVSAT